MSRRMMSTAVAIVLVLAAAGGFLVFHGTAKTMHVTVEFPQLVAVYEGSSVRVLGVSIGKVEKITPHGSSVTVEIAYSSKYKVPQDATAAVIAPAIVGDRYVQLAPAYTSGPVMKNNAEIPLKRTEVPVELDQIFTSLDNLNKALGPQGANAKGALSRLIDVGAANLGNGNGQRLHDALHGVSTLVATLDDSRDSLVGLINHLGGFTTMLAQDDANVRAANRDLAAVAGQLADDRQELSAAVGNLSIALGEINGLVKDNRKNLTVDIQQLADITGTLVKEKRNLTEFLDVAPLALRNLQDAFDPQSNSLGTRGNFDFATNPSKEFLDAACSNLTGQLKVLCESFGGASVQAKAKGSDRNASKAKSWRDLLGVPR